MARVQKTTGTKTAGASTIAITLSSSPVNGDAIFAVIASASGVTNRVSSITQTGATWTRQVQTSDGALGAGTCEVEKWAAFNVSGAGTSITITFAATGFFAAAVVAEYNAIATSSALDKTAVNDEGTALGGPGTTLDSGTTATTTAQFETWIAGFCTDTTIATYTPGTNWTNVGSATPATSTLTAYMDEQIVTSTGAANDAPTTNVATDWAGVVATFKPPPAVAGQTGFFGSD